ncbi:MAG: phage/plasmid primase, P4 family [Myxococcaceae bacterium]
MQSEGTPQPASPAISPPGFVRAAIVRGKANPEIAAERDLPLAMPVREGQKDGLGIIPAIFSKPHRADANVTHLTALFGDIDGVTYDVCAQIEARLEASGFEFGFYETHSHGQGGLCSARVIVPFAEVFPVICGDWKAMRAAMLQHLGLFADADPATSALSSFYYTPRCPRGETRRSYHHDGKRLDWRPFAVALTPAPQAAAVRGYFPPASEAVLADVRAALAVHGPAISGNGGDDHTFKAAALLRHDFALTFDEAWPLFIEWNAGCQPPWADADLRSKLEGGDEYGTGEYGSKRTADVLQQVDLKIAAWRDGGASDNSIPELITEINNLVRRGVDKPTHEAISRKIEENTGYGPRKQGLAAAVDIEARAAAQARRELMESGAAGLIDARAPFETAKQLQRSTEDGEGMPEWAFWNGDYLRAEISRYVMQPIEVLKREIYNFIDQKVDAATGNTVKADRDHVERVKHAMDAVALVSVKSTPAWIGGNSDLDPTNIIAFRNGLYDLPSGRFFALTRRFFTQNALPYDYVERPAKPEAWFAFLRQIWPDDNESVATLQEVFGLMLTCDTSFQKVFMVVGPKRAGKGTIARVLMAMLGADNVCGPTLNSLSQNFGLQPLIGKQCAVISDARVTGRTDIGTIAENILRISGEDTISVPRKFRDDWVGRLPTRILMLANEPPTLTDQAGALSSRFILLQLRQTFFGREDRGLENRLLQELPGILFWSLRGLERLRHRGHFLQPASAAPVVEQFENLSSPVKSFVSERCELGSAHSTDVGTLYEEWRMWSITQGRAHIEAKPVFVKSLTGAFPELKLARPRDDDGGKQRKHYVGIRIRPHESG